MELNGWRVGKGKGTGNCEETEVGLSFEPSPHLLPEGATASCSQVPLRWVGLRRFSC